MTTYVALLRAVNLPGHNKVGMADLRVLLAEIGCENPRSLLQSGNLVFGSDIETSAELEGVLERAAKDRLGLETDILVRTAGEWTTLIGRNPFPEEAERDPSHLLVVFLRKAPRRADVAALQKAIAGREVVRASGRQAYIVYPDGIGHSRLTNLVIEKRLATRGTGRNWNTVVKLGAIVGA